jgi:hypothetical protein
MAKRKNFIQGAIDSLRELFQTRPIKQAVEKADRRSVSRGKSIIRDLEKTFRDKEIAESLEISRQKYSSLKRQIKSGKVASSTLNDLLEQAGEKAKENTGRPRDEVGLYISDVPVNGKSEFKIDYEEMGQNWITKSIPWATEVKPGGFASKQSALNWYGGVTGGKEYFKIVKGRKNAQGRYRYHIYDVRTQQERTRKGSVTGKMKAQGRIDRDRIK